MTAFVIQIIRSLVPLLVGWLVGVLLAINVHIPADIEAGAVLSLSTLAASLYYLGVSWLERKFPWVGWLLGVARKPVYDYTPKHAA